MRRRVVVEIAELVVRGVPAAGGRDLARQFSRELERLFAAPNDAGFRRAALVERVRATAVAAAPAQTGRAAARALFAALPR